MTCTFFLLHHNETEVFCDLIHFYTVLQGEWGGGGGGGGGGGLLNGHALTAEIIFPLCITVRFLYTWK